MVLAGILNELSDIAHAEASSDQFSAFKAKAMDLVYTPGPDKSSRAFDQITSDQIAALNSPEPIENPNEFQRIILFMTDLFNDPNLDISIRALAASFAFCKYHGTLPATELALDNLHLKECLQWGNRVLDAQIIGNQHEAALYKIKRDICPWIASFHACTNAPQLAAESCEKLVKDALDSSHCRVSDVISALLVCVNYYRETIMEGHTLCSPEVKRLIDALKRLHEFCVNVPENKKTYLSLPVPARRNLCAWAGIAEVVSGPLVQDDSIYVIWDNTERWHALRTAERVKGELGKLYALIPVKTGEKPNYKQAAMWIYLVLNCDYVNLREELKIPEIQAEIEAMTKPTERGVFCNPQNPSAPPSDDARDVAHAAGPSGGG